MLLLWTLLAGVFWVAGAAVDPEWRLLLWLAAVIVDYAAPLAQFRIPGVGAAPMHLWDPDAAHLAERNRLVFIIALGESILLMGAYAHALMVLGAILVAVSIELRLTHDHMTPGIVFVTVGGPLVYLAGNVLFLKSRFGRLARSRFVAAAVLALIGIVVLLLGETVPLIALSLAVLAVMATLAALTAHARRNAAIAE